MEISMRGIFQIGMVVSLLTVAFNAHARFTCEQHFGPEITMKSALERFEQSPLAPAPKQEAWLQSRITESIITTMRIIEGSRLVVDPSYLYKATLYFKKHDANGDSAKPIEVFKRFGSLAVEHPSPDKAVIMVPYSSIPYFLETISHPEVANTVDLFMLDDANQGQHQTFVGIASKGFEKTFPIPLTEIQRYLLVEEFSKQFALLPEVKVNGMLITPNLIQDRSGSVPAIALPSTFGVVHSYGSRYNYVLELAAVNAIGAYLLVHMNETPQGAALYRPEKVFNFRRIKTIKVYVSSLLRAPGSEVPQTARLRIIASGEVGSGDSQRTETEVTEVQVAFRGFIISSPRENIATISAKKD